MEHLKGEHLLIRADASTQMGTGHLMRCLALAQAWKDRGGQAIFVTSCQNESLLQRLREEEFDIYVIAHPYPEPGHWEHMRDILIAFPHAWVVLDGYHFDESYQQRIKEAGHRLLVIDDMAHLKCYYADIVMNQNLNAEQLSYSWEPYTRLLLGTRYVLLRREFLAWKGWTREIPEVARRVLVTLGGSDPKNYTLKAIQALERVDVADLETTVVIGASNPHTGLLEAAARQSRIPIRLIHNAQNMPELMAQANVAISSAGSTVWELLFLGTPALFLISANNQRFIAEKINSLKTGKTLGWAQDVSVQSLTESIKSILKDYESRSEISKNAGQLVDGGGSQRVVNALQETTA